MRRIALPALLAAFAAIPAAGPVLAGEYDAALTALAHGPLAAIAADPVLIAAIKAQNGQGAPSMEEIERLDRDWRAQVGAGDAPLVNEVAGREASSHLVAARDASEGLITEIFAMDHVGLNVAVSDPTSDYWQGDEAKWQQTYKAGPGAIHVSDVELDESTQTYQAQVSMTVEDGGAAIGAITFGVNVEMLN